MKRFLPSLLLTLIFLPQLSSAKSIDDAAVTTIQDGKLTMWGYVCGLDCNPTTF